MCGTYNVARNSRRWPLTIFFDVMNIAAINALVLYQLNHSDLTIIRSDLLRTLALDLIKPQISRRLNFPIPKAIKEKCRVMLDMDTHSETTNVLEAKRLKTGNGRCYICPPKKDKRTRNYCVTCSNWVCKEHQKKSKII